MKSRFILLFLLLVLIGQVAVADELTSEKTQDIKSLMNVTGGIAKQFAAASSQQIFQALKTSRSEIPDRALAVIEKELIALFEEKMARPVLWRRSFLFTINITRMKKSVNCSHFTSRQWGKRLL